MMNPNNPLTPGVYIQELNAFPNSIVEVATAVPVFIGYTQQAGYQGNSFHMKPVAISSMNDYITFFGGGPNYKVAAAAPKNPGDPYDFSLSNGTTSTPYVLSAVPNTMFYLYNSLQLFYQNGGGKCYIVSVGTYSAPNGISYPDLKAGLDKVANEIEPTLIVIPDGLLLDEGNYSTLMANMLKACSDAQSRFALFDLQGGDTFVDALTLAADDLIGNFRNDVGENYLNYGAAYFPWLQTTIVQKTDVNFSYFDTTLVTALTAADQGGSPAVAGVYGKVGGLLKGGATPADPQDILKANNSLLAVSANYNTIIKAVTKFLNVLPAAPAMAGVYTAVDNNRGVWKAPANVSLTAVTNPLYNFTDDEQGEIYNLNVDAVSGKSINLIRSFPGVGVLVWGARTLDGNSQDWKYINVRRTMIMIEQSVKLAARNYVFEPNVANTWVTVQCMISNFLNGLWKQGALAGAKAEDAYSVSVGLGTTMTGDDILNGIMRIAVLVAVSHPAEFLVITFEQQMQKS
ncbi:MAG TPA: phage tail sheath C-terminal domain-containing protein [Mucilaginibacter sp.]|jgi:phage tail sheath protein FI|nr:phage tail sheath C-terminal domain-containing protein [Mucilaginibacter sp.]